MKIFPVKTEEVGLLQRISIDSFTESFANDNKPENMRAYMDSAYDLDKLRRELEDQRSEFYFAKINEQYAGYMKLNFGSAQTELQDENALEIERIYVLEIFQRSGVGAVLLQHAIDIALQKNLHFLWLGVWERNFKAQNFYKKHGFKQFSSHSFWMGDDEQTDVLMKKDLK